MPRPDERPDPGPNPLMTALGDAIEAAREDRRAKQGGEQPDLPRVPEPKLLCDHRCLLPDMHQEGHQHGYSLGPGSIRGMEDRVRELEAENERLRAHILDIDAHATPFGDIPDDPGYTGVYLLTAGALHRALGKIGHTAPSCQAEAERDAARAELAQRGELVGWVPLWDNCGQWLHASSGPFPTREAAEQYVAEAVRGGASYLYAEVRAVGDAGEGEPT